MDNYRASDPNDPGNRRAAWCRNSSSPEMGAGALLSRHIVWIEDLTAIKGLTATADTHPEPVTYGLQRLNLGIKAGTPCFCEAFPVLFGWRSLWRQGCEALADFFQWQPNLLGRTNERHTTQHISCVASLPHPQYEPRRSAVLFHRTSRSRSPHPIALRPRRWSTSFRQSCT